jgi:hypothetical protein
MSLYYSQNVVTETDSRGGWSRPNMHTKFYSENLKVGQHLGNLHVCATTGNIQSLLLQRTRETENEGVEQVAMTQNILQRRSFANIFMNFRFPWAGYFLTGSVTINFSRQYLRHTLFSCFLPLHAWVMREEGLWFRTLQTYCWISSRYKREHWWTSLKALNIGTLLHI